MVGPLNMVGVLRRPKLMEQEADSYLQAMLSQLDRQVSYLKVELVALDLELQAMHWVRPPQSLWRDPLLRQGLMLLVGHSLGKDQQNIQPK